MAAHPLSPRPATGLPLDGITVVTVEQAVAAPLATRHLADLGARVVKIERTGEGDFARDYDHAVDGLASHFVWLNRSKESVAVDLKRPEGRAIVAELISGADVFVQNLAPGAADRLGLGAQALRAEHPRLIVADLSGYGTKGPLRDHKAYDMLVQAESGLVSITGTPESPAKTGIPTSDIATGLYIFSGVLAALFARERTGVGAHLEVSMFDATVEWMGHPMYLAMYAGIQPPRMGLAHPAIAPYDAYPTADGQVLIGIQNDRGWRALVCEVFDKPELVDDPRFITNIDRVAHRAEVDATVAELSRGFTTAALSEALAAAGIAAAQVNDVAQMIAHPQLAQRDRWRTVPTPVGDVPALLPPISLEGLEPRMDAVPALGAHTAQVLDELGYTTAQTAALAQTGVVQLAD